MKTVKKISPAKAFISSKWALPAVALVAVIIGFAGVEAFSNKNSRISKAACSGICVSIEPGGINPSELAVKTGEFVQFNTADNRKHNLSLGNGQDAERGDHDALAHEHTAGFESGEFGPGEAYRVQFKKPGTYVMHDHDYPSNRILIVVYTPKS